MTLRRLLMLFPLLAALGVTAAHAQVLGPEESTAKAKELIQQAIEALGGEKYLNLRDASCTGRFASYDNHGQLTGFTPFWDFNIYPDKSRTEYSSKRNVIFVYNGNQGWVLDRGGVEVAPADDVDRFQEGLLKSADHLLRYRLKEEGLSFRYLGTEIVDLKRMDWIEIVDRERRSIRLALDQKTRLPMRTMALVRDRATRRRVEELETLSNYHSFGGVMMPKQIARDQNGRQVYKVFFTDCQFNTGLDEMLFTREGLDQTWVKLGKK